jgi:centromeric protein E
VFCYCKVGHRIVSWSLQQLSDSLLEIEEERAIWSAKEKASIEVIQENTKLYNVEIMMLSKAMAEV